MRCTECGTIFPFPREDIKKYVSHVDNVTIAMNNTENIRDQELITLRKIVRAFNIKSALDVGCGTGRLCNQLESLDVETFGIEISEQATKIASSNGVNCSTGSFPDVSGPRTEYNMITMSEVIYYFPDLKAALKKARQILTDKGILLIKTNMPEVYRKRTGKSVQEKSNEAVQSVVTMDSIIYWLVDSGFEIIEIIPYHDEYYKMIFGYDTKMPPIIQQGFNLVYRNICNPEHERYIFIARKAPE